MMKKVIKNLSTMALAVIIGVSAFGPIAHAMESSMRSVNGVACPWCSSIDVDDLGSSVIGCTYASQDSHLVRVRYSYQCNPCHTEFNEYDSYYESHDYGFDPATGGVRCSGCGDSY